MRAVISYKSYLRFHPLIHHIIFEFISESNSTSFKIGDNGSHFIWFRNIWMTLLSGTSLPVRCISNCFELVIFEPHKGVNVLA